MDLLTLPLPELILKRRGLRRELLTRPGLVETRVAVLGGSTTNEVVDLLDVLLLDGGRKPVFYQSEYGRFYEDAVLEPETVAAFKPDVVYVHTTWKNLQRLPPPGCTEEGFKDYVDSELSRFRLIWTSLTTHVGCQIIQNNFDLPPATMLGNFDAVSPAGLTRFILELNRLFAAEAASNSRLILQDLSSIASRIGIDRWFDPSRWFSYKLACSTEGSLAIAKSLKALILAMYGRSRKVLVLDLDNTLWGGVIGDDGVDNIVIGRETALSEAYTAFQEYCLRLREQGILLAVCSKNDEANAVMGFLHPESVLKLDHFSAFKANWKPKHENVQSISEELNLGLDSFVFVDDNPAERAIVAAQLPQVAVPELGNDVAAYPGIIDAGRYFEPLSLGGEDLGRAELYKQNTERAKLEQTFANYGEYLASLEMTAEIDTFKGRQIERIAQLTNKTNQFNLTTRRYTPAEIQATMTDGKHLGLFCKLRDRFGDNGLISVVLGRREGTLLHMELWLMSCRVLKREVELAMLDQLAEHARTMGIQQLVGYYVPSAKNAMVADHYERLGFEQVTSNADTTQTVWTLNLQGYQPRSQHIAILETANV